MLDTKKLNVVKIPKSGELGGDNSGREFPRMGRMYLELLENKDKIKPELINRDYDPNDADSVLSFYTSKDEKVTDYQKSSFNNREEELEVVEEVSEVNSEENEEENEEENYEENEEENEDDGSLLEEEEDNVSQYSEDESEFRSPSERMETLDEIESIKSYISEKNEQKTMLKEMLHEETAKRPSPPRLSDLQKEGMLKTSRVVPNLDYLEEEVDEDEEDKKRELLFKFELLKKSYKNVSIPEFTIHSSLKKMNETYENQLRHLSLDSSVEGYKNILVGGFMIFEFIFGVWLKFDMSGFTQQQILNMNQYERLLIELGQKSYVPEGQQWAVEFRLVGLIVLNAVIFIISKLILKRTGSNLMGMMNHVQVPNNVKVDAPKKKMKGPSIDLDDLEEEEELSSI